jgi:hypothetical protein
MDRRTFLVCLAGVSSLVFAKPQGCCPVCGGSLRFVGEVTDNTLLPSKNVKVWNRSYHGDPAWPFHDDSPICSRCYIAYSDELGKWTKASESAEAFFVPLQSSVSSFPLPSTSLISSLVVYSQEFAGIGANEGRQESVLLWFRNSPEALDLMRMHASSNNLELTLFSPPSHSGETCVTATTQKVKFEPVAHR